MHELAHTMHERVRLLLKSYEEAPPAHYRVHVSRSANWRPLLWYICGVKFNVLGPKTTEML